MTNNSLDLNQYILTDYQQNSILVISENVLVEIKSADE